MEFRIGISSIILNKYISAILGIIARFFQGVSIGAYHTLAYSYIPHFWRDQIEIRIGILEFSVGLGVGFGPILGSIIYYFGSILLIYVFISIVLVGFGLFLVKTIIPYETNQNYSKQNSEKLNIMVKFIL
jgi:MFS family permease